MPPFDPIPPSAIRCKARAHPSSPWRAASGAWLLTLTACATAPMDTPENLVAAPSMVGHAASDPSQASTSSPRTPVPVPEPTPVQGASEVTGQWEGRLSLKLGAFGAASSSGSQMSFELDVKGSQGTLSLSTPLGTRMAMVRWLEQATPGQTTAQLETSDGVQTFDSLEALTQQLLGEALPLRAMLHWLRGHPSPSLPHEPAQGQALAEPRAFTQAGWQVDATALQEGKLNAFRAETATQRSVMLRLRLDL
jgi:outer membrane lipoprotein LolB